MLKKERQQLILAELNAHAKVVTARLSSQLRTSEDTIRRDLNELAQAGLLIKVHGGAMALPVAVDTSAQRAVALITEGLQLLLSKQSAPTVSVLMLSLRKDQV